MSDPEQLVADAGAVAGPANVDPGGPSDSVAGVRPRIVASPPDVETLCRLLAWAERRRLAVVPVGGGTKLAWGCTPGAVDVALSTRRLGGVIDHRHADLTATVGAGASLAAVNRELGAHRQWLACDVCWPDRATIGGILATNDSGPRRHRHGAPRDLLIGVTFVTADGTLAHAGGRVVKNVAGYDLGKLLVGSHGSLGVIVEATFKLLPRPAASRTVEARAGSLEPLTRFARAVGAGRLDPSAVEIIWPPPCALVRFESVGQAVAQQAARACEIARTDGMTARVLNADEETACWEAHAARPWAAQATVVSLGIPASLIARELAWLEEMARPRGVEALVVGRLAMGSLRAGLTGPLDAQAVLIGELRARARGAGGHVVLLRACRDLRAAVDPWGPLGDAARVMRAVKARFDPQGILSPGRWPAAEAIRS